MILEMKSKVSPDTFNRLVIVMAMPCVLTAKAAVAMLKIWVLYFQQFLFPKSSFSLST
jgi:hypothetical protein